MEIREISDADKAAIKGELKAMPMNDLVATHRRLHQWAAQGNILSGFTKADMEWLHSAVESELVRRAKEDDREPPESSPLEWKSAQPPEEAETDTDDERWLPKTVIGIIAKAKKEKSLRADDDVERRTFTVPELRVDDTDQGPRISGYAAVFNQRSEELGGFVEEVDPGAFNRTIQETDVRALWQHNPEYVLGRTKNGTLRLAVDEFGLRYEAYPPDAQWARDAVASVRRGDVNQSSFGFKTIRDQWSSEATIAVRRLMDVDLLDVSPVTFPAYPQTSAQVRARALEIQTAPGQAPHADGDAQRQAQERLDMLRRRLRLTELS